MITRSVAGSVAGSVAWLGAGGTLAIVLAACSSSPGGSRSPTARSGGAALSLAAEDRMIAIPVGRYIKGSTPEERAAAYDEYQRTAGDDTARTEQWFERESDRTVAELPAFRIDLMPVTQSQFAEFVAVEPSAMPAVDEAAWHAQGFAQDYASQVARFVWKDGRPPDGREDHPVVLVSWTDAGRYCAWRGKQYGQPRRLPTADEFEKAARGATGMNYPWGGLYEADKLNSAVGGPGDTTPVGTYTTGASPYGVLDMAGNVLQWTSTSLDDQTAVVKGSSWGDVAGIGRGSSLLPRAKTVRHVLIGFRCAAAAAH